ncbi:MAG: porphobilinogen synthase [Planctomycetota bacterium]|jgi:porphobilinogen synthase|nr:porphobilinogen synthase [Planctomycetota bacterium]MDP6762922.1 porphobilinogen synthase [Planctomycetota bacterium]MDP6988616.1 porphobilinogen synthase [Planctomycetota bacterium]
MSEPSPAHPASRPRRLRRGRVLRELVSETRLDASRLIMPHFVLPDERGEEPVASMPGIARTGTEPLLRAVGADLEHGLRSVLLFGLARDGRKDARGSEARDPSGAVPRAVAALKREFGADLLVITDVCLCAATDHGHCGVLEEGVVRNDESLPLLAEAAVVHAEAGADMVAPSDMMDGRVGALRTALDGRGLVETGILSYAVKYASAYYGPFRDAANSAPGSGDRKSYQMDTRNAREAEREALLDEAEGADVLMVKPALAYLDVLHRVREVTRLPLAAYNVSGEYAAVKAASERGWLDEPALVRENLTAMARAGADVILTYHAREAVAGGWL